MRRARLGICQAAEALGVDRGTVRRWKKRPGAPFGPDGSVDLVELRAWATIMGLLGRKAGRPPEAQRLAEDAAPAPSQLLVPASSSAGAAIAPAPPAPELVVEALSESDREALSAIVAGDADKLVELAATVDPLLLKKLAVMGRTRRELAEAERRELENKANRGELVPVEAVRGYWAGQIALVKTHFQALPGKLSSRLLEKTYDEIYLALELELRALLDAFSAELPAFRRG